MGNEPQKAVTVNEQKKVSDHESSSSVVTASGVHSSFGKGDPIKEFITTIKDCCEEGDLPPYRKEKTYQIYEWSKGSFDHKSIVVGCDSHEKYAFITMELRVNGKEQKIIPFSKYFSHDDGISKIESEKWVLIVGKLKTKLVTLAHLALDLIEHHGSYSKSFNNCQTFVAAFKYACQNPTWKIGRKTIAMDAATTYGKGSVIAGTGSILAAKATAPNATAIVAGGMCTVVLGGAVGAIGGYLGAVGGGITNENKYEKVSLNQGENLDPSIWLTIGSYIKEISKKSNESGTHNKEIGDWLEKMKDKINNDVYDDDDEKDNISINDIEFFGYGMKENSKDNNKESSFESGIGSVFNYTSKGCLYWIKIIDNNNNSWVINRQYYQLVKVSSFLETKLKITVEKCYLTAKLADKYLEDNEKIKQHLLNMQFYFQELLYTVLKEKGAPYDVLQRFLTVNKVGQEEMEKFLQENNQN